MNCDDSIYTGCDKPATHAVLYVLEGDAPGTRRILGFYCEKDGEEQGNRMIGGPDVNFELDEQQFPNHYDETGWPKWWFDEEETVVNGTTIAIGAETVWLEPLENISRYTILSIRGIEQ